MKYGEPVSSWLETGSHTACPNGHPEVRVAYFVYADDTTGWEYRCPVCGANGPAVEKNADDRGGGKDERSQAREAGTSGHEEAAEQGRRVTREAPEEIANPPYYENA